MSVRLGLLSAVALVVLPAAAAAAPDPADALAAAIDRRLAADWQARGIIPADPADDAEFCRRVYLDLLGRAPKAAETRDFLDDKATDKRKVLVEKLLASPVHAVHFAAVTRASWLPQTVSNPQFIGSGNAFETWLRARFKENTPADEVVRRIITAPVRSVGRGPNNRFIQSTGTDPEAGLLASFYQAIEGRAENAGAAVSRLFVGVKLECAQCHDHPFAPYTRQQFWEFAAFYADLEQVATFAPNGMPPPALAAKDVPLTLPIPNTDKTATAKFFDGDDLTLPDGRTPRQELADWLTRKDNPYLAKNLANRMWAHFFGYGVLDPVDEPGDNNPPTHPELLDDLGRAFAAGGFDNRLLIRAITRTKAYQLSSKMTHPTQADARRFARMNVKALTPAQLFDSLVSATGYRENANNRNDQFASLRGGPNNPRGVFLNRFASTEKITERDTTILQALMLMNGKFVGDQTGLESSEVLAAVADAPFWTTQQKVEALFISALARKPTPTEAERYGSYVERGGVHGDQNKALADVFWVLLNSTEFLFNH
jgi:hypothetical protein